MIIPNLDNVYGLKCVKSKASWWIEGKTYVVNNKFFNNEGGDRYYEGEGPAMDFEIIYKEEPEPEKDMIKNPAHYIGIDGENDIITNVRGLSLIEWRGAVKFSIAKYRMRAGKKEGNSILQEIGKAERVESLYEEYKQYCYDYKGGE